MRGVINPGGVGRQHFGGPGRPDRADGSTRRFDVGDTPAAIAGNASGVWVTATLERRVWQLRPDGAVIRQIALDGIPAGIAVGDDRVWVALRSS
jgi:hypothetical protein